MKKIELSKIEEYYSNRLKEHGPNSRGAGWGAPEAQLLRFNEIIKIIPQKEQGITIAELGCGYGAMIESLKNNNISYNSYTGVDISKPMIKEAQKKYTDRKHQFLVSNKISSNYDYIVSSGIFNISMGENKKDWLAYSKQTIIEMYEKCDKGIAFNMISTYVDFEEDHICYFDPKEILTFCLESFGRKVLLNHSYPLFEFTVMVWK